MSRWWIVLGGIGIEVPLLAAFAAGGFGPCGPANPLGAIGYVGHIPALLVVAALNSIVSLPDKIAVSIGIVVQTGLWMLVCLFIRWNYRLFRQLLFMKASLEVHNQFLDGALLPGLRFRHNDYVLVMRGDRRGEKGSIVSVEELGDDPLFLVELESGQNALFKQSDLQLIGGPQASHQ